MAEIGRLKITMCVALVVLTTLSAQEATPAPQKTPENRSQKTIIRPGPRISPGFRLTVQKEPRFANAQPGERSIPAEERGLEVTLQPEQAVFSDRGPLAFRLTYRNTSDKAFLLDRPDRLGHQARLVIANQQSAAQWTLKSDFPKLGAASLRLEPGASLGYTLVVSSRPVVLPRPWPVRPTPFPRRLQEGDSKTPKADAKQGTKPRPPRDVRRHPPVILPRPHPVPVPPIVISQQLPCGPGPCRAMLLIEFRDNPKVNDGGRPHWVGKLATRPVNLTVQGSRPIIIQPRPRIENRPIFRKPVEQRRTDS